MIRVTTLREWLDTLGDDPDLAVYLDDGGLTLCVWAADASLEIGGEPTSIAEEQRSPGGIHRRIRI